jgi:hypothetical protein
MTNMQTLEELKESIQRLQTELNCFRDPWTEQLSQSSINLAAVPTILPSILDDIPALSLSPDDVVNNKDHEESPLATPYDNALSHVTTTILALFYRHESHIASIGSFFYSNASTLYRLGIG